MARIYDNIETKFEEGLQGIITTANVERVDFCVGYFNLRGWDRVADQIDRLPGGTVYETVGSREVATHRVCRLLIGMHRPPEEIVRSIYCHSDQLVDSEYAQRCKLKIAQQFRQQLLIGNASAKDEQTLRQLCRQLKEGKVCVKLYLQEPLHAKLYLAYRPNDFSSRIIGIMGSSNLTYSGFKGQGELNADFTDSDHVEKLAQWFDDRWNNRFSLDISQELIDAIENSWAADKVIPPYHIYLKTIYHLCAEARNGIKEFSLTPEFRRELFPFQQNAVQIAARHLSNEKHGGAMIGDVVGLGKTITACAIAKIYETTYGCSSLVICPANLQEMWKKYAKKYDLKIDIHSMSKAIDVNNARYYRLVIIDESHNLRNGAIGRRYRNIKELIERQGNNVLLLTATPYNMDFDDLANQLKLFLKEDQDLGIRPETYISSIGGDRAFLSLHNEVHIRSIRAFEKSPYAEDWNDLMKLFLVRRTRTFIKNNYAEVDPNNGRRYLTFGDGTRSYFPDRVPRAIKFETHPNDQYSRLYSEEMLGKIDSLLLPRYGLALYIDPQQQANASEADLQLMENLSRAGNRMMGFCRSTFFKRADSSGYAFLLTLYRHILRNMVFVYAIENHKPLPIGDENALPDEFVDDADTNSTLFDTPHSTIATNEATIGFPTDIEFYRHQATLHYNNIAQKTNLAWIDCHYFSPILLDDLINDCHTLLAMIALCGAWQTDDDRKLQALQQLLTKTHATDKVIIFTQYADTANYICQQLRRRGIQKIEQVTGNSLNPTAVVDRFSPKSNGATDVTPDEELRVVVATDVLSEGQNLQDAHVIVNYDLPWAIIRLIQRAGRVDRIGQQEDKIFCYSFFPADGIEEIISLRQRLNDRINANANIVGSDEVFFEGNEQNLRDMFNEKSGVLDDTDDTDVDLASQAYQIWKNATDDDPMLEQIIPTLPNMVYSTKEVDGGTTEGVVTYARTADDFDRLSLIAADGSVVSQSQRHILETMACHADTPALPPMAQHHELVDTAMQGLREQNTTSAVGGMLGSRFSTRYRLIELLKNCHANPSNLFNTEEKKQAVKLAIDDLYNHQMTDTSKLMLGRMLHHSATVDDIVDQVIELRTTGLLCRMANSDSSLQEPQIICSMGLRHNTNNTCQQ